MATRTAVKSGNWSAGDTWDSNPTLPGAGDTADCAGYDVTIDQDVTVTLLTTTGAGSFLVTAAHNITAAITSGTGASDWVLKDSHTTGTVAIVGAVTAGPHGGVYRSAAGTLTIEGAITAGSGTQPAVLAATGGTGGTVTITGAIAGSATAHGLQHSGTSTVNITGDITTDAGSYMNGVYNGSTGTVNIEGDVTGGSANWAEAVVNAAGGTINITGDVTGGSAANCNGIDNGSTGTVTVSGSATGGSNATAYGAYNFSTGTLTVGRAVSSATTAGVYGKLSTGTTRLYELEFNSNGQCPLLGYCKVVPDSTRNVLRAMRSDTGAALDLSWDYPAEADVEDGVDYALGTLTGTLEVGGGEAHLDSEVLDTAGTPGTYHAPDAAEVISTAVFGVSSGTSGTVVLPAVGDVQDGVTFGPGSASTGTFAVPAEEDVESGVKYGADGTEFTGSLVGGGGVPDWTDDEKKQIRQALGITGDTAATSGTGNLDLVLEDTGTTLPAEFSGLATDADIADAVWDETRAGHTTDGTYGDTDEWAASSAPSADDIAAKILVTPANLLATDASGYITGITGTKHTLDDVAGSDGDTLKTLSDQMDLVTTVLAGITSLAKWLRALFRKDTADATAKAEINLSGGTFDETTDSLQAIRDTAPLGTAMRGTDGAYTGTPPSAADIADAVLDEAKGTHAGHIASIPTNPYTGTPPAASAIADAVWDETLADHAATGSTGEALTNASAAGDPWATALPGSYADGTAGDIIGNFVADVWSRSPRTLTTPAQTAETQAAAGALEIVRGVTWTATLETVAFPATWVVCLFTVKRPGYEDDADDAAAILQLQLSKPAAASDGLLRLNGAAATAATGSLVANESAATLTPALTDEVTLQLVKRARLAYDVKFLLSDDSSVRERSGALSVVATPTATV